MTDENESTPWTIWAIKGFFVILVSFILILGVLFLTMIVPWMLAEWIGPTLLLSGLAFFVGNVVLLESKDPRLWLYSVITGYLIAIGSIILATLWSLTFIPVPVFGNAFYATITAVIIAAFTTIWYWTGNNEPSVGGTIASASKSISSQKLVLGASFLSRRDTYIEAIELMEMPREYVFDEEEKKNLRMIIEYFHNIVRALTAIPYALRIERKNWKTRIFFLTWESDESLLAHQKLVLHDALSHNLLGFKFSTPAQFQGLILDESESGSAAIITGVPLSIHDENQQLESLETMTGVLQDLENGIFQIFVEPVSMSKSNVQSLKSRYKRTVEQSESTISRDKSGWIHGEQQESKTTINPEAKMKAAKLERQILRLSTPHLCKTTVTCVSWDNDIAQADQNTHRLTSALLGSLRPADEKDEFRVEYKAKRKYVFNLMRGQPVGNSTILTPNEACTYLILPRTDVGIPVTKREKFSSGTRESQSVNVNESAITEKITSLVKTRVKWRERVPSLFLGNPMDKSGKIVPNAHLLAEISYFDMHLGVFGNTRSGKSTTAMNIIGQAISLGINPIILVPSKGYEWRKLLKIFPDVRIFTCGRDDISNLVYSIWNPPKGVRITKWIDRVVQVLTLWMPNDEVIAMHIEDVIYTVYQNCGWNLETNQKGRPILLPDLVDAVREVSQRLDYGDEVSSNIYGALVARIKSILRKPALVSMYNTLTGVTVTELLSHPIIIEMDALSENDKILLMGILTAAVSEYKLANPTKKVSNLLVLEEAHYLLSGTDITGEANSGVRLQAVSAFIEMLRVLGGTGLGVILIDQSPSSLVPQAIKIPVNMIIHALSHEDDRRLVGKHARCTEAQIEHIGGMQVGEAVVYLQHEGEPKNVKMFTLNDMISDEIAPEDVDERTIVECMKKVWAADPTMYTHMRLPEGIMDRFSHREETESQIPTDKLSVEYREDISRAVASPEFSDFCKESLENKEVRAIVNLLHAVSERHGNNTWWSLLYTLERAVDKYGTDDTMKVFGQVGQALDAERV